MARGELMKRIELTSVATRTSTIDSELRCASSKSALPRLADDSVVFDRVSTDRPCGSNGMAEARFTSPTISLHDWVFAADDEDTLPAGPDGIDEQRIMEAILRLEEVAQELGWSTVLRVFSEMVLRREQALTKREHRIHGR